MSWQTLFSNLSQPAGSLLARYLTKDIGLATALKEMPEEDRKILDQGLLAAVSLTAERAAEEDAERATRIRDFLGSDEYGWSRVRKMFPVSHDLATYEAFRCSPKWPALAEALAATKDWAAPGGFGLLFLGGPPGVGKTHLMEAAYGTLLALGREAVMLTEAQLQHSYHQAMREHNLEWLTGEVNSIPWLLIDDLGLVAGGDWWQGILDELLNLRWKGAPGIKTIFAANLKSEDFSPRIASRLRDTSNARRVLMPAPDYRRLKRPNSEN